MNISTNINISTQVLDGHSMKIFKDGSLRKSRSR